jgi:hypothetical protein
MARKKETNPMNTCFTKRTQFFLWSIVSRLWSVLQNKPIYPACPQGVNPVNLSLMGSRQNENAKQTQNISFPTPKQGMS